MEFTTEDGTRVTILAVPVDEDSEDPLVTVVRSIEADLEGQGWDQRPAMMAITQELGFAGMQTILMPGPFYDRPADFLELFAMALKEEKDAGQQEALERMNHFLKEKVLPASYAGLAFFFEAWTVSAREGTDKADEVVEAALKRELHEHPDRVEIRSGFALHCDGRRVFINRKRGGIPKAGDLTTEEHVGRVMSSLEVINAHFASLMPNPLIGGPS